MIRYVVYLRVRPFVIEKEMNIIHIHMYGIRLLFQNLFFSDIIILCLLPWISFLLKDEFPVSFVNLCSN